MKNINGVSYSNITRLSGKLKANMTKFMGRSKPASASLITSDLLFNVDASNSDSYDTRSISDSIGRVNGSFGNGAYVDTNESGGMIYTDGVNDEVTWDNRSPLLFNTRRDKTLQAWIQVLDESVNYWVMTDMGPSRDRGHYIRILGGKVMFGGSTDGANSYKWQITRNQVISQKQKVLVTVVHKMPADGEENATVEFYINDSEVAQEGYPDYPGVFQSYNDSSAASTTSGIYYNRSLPYEGRIGQMLVYDKALTSAEITQNYNATKSRFGL